MRLFAAELSPASATSSALSLENSSTWEMMEVSAVAPERVFCRYSRVTGFRSSSSAANVANAMMALRGVLRRRRAAACVRGWPGERLAE